MFIIAETIIVSAETKYYTVMGSTFKWKYNYLDNFTSTNKSCYLYEVLKYKYQYTFDSSSNIACGVHA